MSSLTFTMEAGAFIRGQVKRAIVRGAWDHGLTITTEEEKGWLESLFRFTVTGSSEEVIAFRRSLNEWARKLDVPWLDVP